MAQTDISDYFLVNNGFDLNCNYDASVEGNIGGDIINEVYGWRNETTATYTVAGTFAYNPNVTFNNSSPLPAQGFNGSAGGCLGMTTGWGMKHLYSQRATLPKGKYRLRAAYYNVGSAEAGQSLLAWTPDKSSKTASSVSSFPVGQWIKDEISFTVDTPSSGAIQIGFATSESAGSANHAKLLIDYVKLYCDEMDKSALESALSDAKSLYADGSGNYASELKVAIDAAQKVVDNNNASVTDILTTMAELSKATSEYKYANASAQNPIDMTSAIANPDFEDGLMYWDNAGFIAQTNTSFRGKSGGYYLERWTNIGSKLPDISVSQTITGLREGRYTLRAATGHITQRSAGSSDNNGELQSGAILFAGYSSVEAADQIAAQDLEFIIVDPEVTLGFKTKNATGNWVCFDNCRLYFNGTLTDADYASYLSAYISDTRTNVLTLRAQKSVRDELTLALSNAENLISAGSPRQQLSTAKNALDSAREAYMASAAVYKKLEDGLAYAYTVKSWWEDDAERIDALVQAIAKAEATLADENLTTPEADKAVAELTDAVKKVDKQVYTAQWSMGDINDKNNAWYIGRTRQSKNWILFWEKGYGENPVKFTCGNYTIDVDEVLARAEKAFSFYADSLKYITRGESKTDTYKMVIRLRYEPTEWEASGSGVDDLIGLLTLTPWAAPSRNWQTVYHEVGHCFQYQVHCDNNNHNGWMYAPGSGKGCAFWEQCAQWQAYKIMPDAQFSNEWFDGYMKNVHKHILHESPRYNNFFIQDYWSYRHGMDFMGRLWNESKNPEDAVEAYMRITGISTSEFYDEMYDCAARFATWDIPHLEKYGKLKISSRPQPQLNATEAGGWRIDPSVTPENTGHNIIRLNTPKEAKTVSVHFRGLNGAEGYRSKYPKYAEWRYGFVAYLKDGNRVYSDMGKASYSDTESTLSFECPDNVSRLFLVVSGGSSRYWRQKWDDDDTNDEQWPYEVLFGSTNKFNSPDMPELSAIDIVSPDIELPAIWTEKGLLHIEDCTPGCHVTLTTLSGTHLGTYTTDTAVPLSPGFYIATVTKDSTPLTVHKLLIK